MRKKIKTLRLTIDPKTLDVKLNVPENAAMEEIETFIGKHLLWIKENKTRLSVRLGKTTNLKTMRSIFLFGEEHPLSFKKASRFTYTILETDIQLFVRDFSDAEIQRCLTMFYKRELQRYIEILLPECEKHTGEKAASLNFRAMKTKLGSCNRLTRQITLSTALARYPVACIRMVLIHELVHFKEFSHNARFKALMSKYCPNWRELRRCIKTY